jgi:hypothetical protein
VRALVIAIAVVVGLSSAPARAEPSDRAVIGVGLALALPDYIAGVSLHEGTHAIAAKIVGADVDELHLFPPGRDPHVHTFRFGWTYVHGLRTKGDKVFFYIAPKITDSILLGAFAALLYSGAWPGNRYGEVALTVVGTGLWVDYSKDVVLFSKHNDVVKVLDLWCLKGWRQVPARLLYAGTVVAWGLVVAHAYERTFDAVNKPLDMTPSAARPVVPILTGTF